MGCDDCVGVGIAKILSSRIVLNGVIPKVVWHRVDDPLGWKKKTLNIRRETHSNNVLLENSGGSLPSTQWLIGVHGE